MREGRSLLLMTLPPYEGGVPTKAAILARHLRGLGYRVTVAWYATLGHDPDLVVPSWRIPVGACPSIRTARCFGDFDGVAVGVRLPELEFPYYQPNLHWRRLIAAHERHVAVCGTALVSYPLCRAGVPHLVWCASPMMDDRADRHAAMPPLRKLVDSLVTVPVQRRIEQRILAGCGRLLAVSSYARDALIALGAHPNRIARLPIPIDLENYHPPIEAAPIGVVGFSGRLTDPRKNVGLLIEAIAHANRRGNRLRLRLCGEIDDSLASSARALGVPVEWLGRLAADELPGFYRSLDLFAIPSHQEGFGIVGSEALASGVPVVSTRCGGPADYVRDGETGFLVDANPAAMAEALVRLATDRRLRARCAAAGRALVEREFCFGAFEDGFAEAWRLTWGEEP